MSASWLDATGKPPALIAHAGNTRDRIESFLAEDPSAIEADVYFSNGRFETRHERAIYPIPLWLERWYLRPAPRRRIGLLDLFDLVGRRTGLLLDMKRGSEAAPARVRQVLAECPDRPQIAFCSQFWYWLRAIARENPTVPVLYSIDVQAKFDLFLSIMDRDTVPAGISCRHTLLTPDTVEAMRERGLYVAAWTVDEVERARELISWGVSAITTHQVRRLREGLGLE